MQQRLQADKILPKIGRHISRNGTTRKERKRKKERKRGTFKREREKINKKK